jgi:hypothetical protein
MRRTTALAPLLLLSLILPGRARLWADTTPMIELSKDDSAKAQAVHDNLVQTEKDYLSLQQQMYQGYVKDLHITGYPGALFSADFRFLVGSGDPAPIMALTPEDTAKLVAAYGAFTLAQQDAESFHQHLLETYVAARGSEKGDVSFGNPAVSVPAERAGFQHFRYTQDYRFILPK